MTTAFQAVYPGSKQIPDFVGYLVKKENFSLCEKFIFKNQIFAKAKICGENPGRRIQPFFLGLKFKKDMADLDYLVAAEQISDHPYFGPYQKILLCPEKRTKERIIRDKLFSRLDPFGGHSTRISIERAKRPRYIKEVLVQKADSPTCTFCYPLVLEIVPEPIIFHRKTPGGFTPLSFYNLYEFDKVSLVTVFAEHKAYLGDLIFDDLTSYLESLYDITLFLKETHQSRHVWEFINWGSLAGASQEHPHAQRGSGPFNATTQQEALQIARLTYEEGGDPFEKYLQAIRDSPYFIWESKEPDGLLIHSPFAPKLPHQVDVLPKKRIHHILELTDPPQRNRIARSMLGVFKALYEKLGVTDLNLALHQEFFGIDSNYRLHWHIYPRNLNRLAGIEVGHGTYVVNAFPEETAQVLREHYRQP